MKEQKTAQQILATYHPIGCDHELKTDLWPDSTVIDAMQEYSDQQNAELRNQIADIERENSEYSAVYDSVVKNRDELRERVKELEEICEYALKAIKAVNSPFGATKPIIKRIEKALKK